METFILENSVANNIDDAWLEWKPVNHNPRLKLPDIGEFYVAEGHCLCGVAINNFYQIKNQKNGIVFPEKKHSSVGIGSVCINTFIRGYRFPKYKKKSKVCNRCGEYYIGNCKKCQTDHLRGVIYCINGDCKYRINKHTIKKYSNKMCRSCNEPNR